jgi:two-component sensor histidine kinase
MLQATGVPRVRDPAHMRGFDCELEVAVRERTQELELAIAALVRSGEEKDLLLLEVDHRAKNSLTIASSLLNIHARKHCDPQVQAQFRTARDQLLAMAQVHDLLSKSQTSQLIELGLYLDELCATLRPIVEHDRSVALVRATETGILVRGDSAVSLGIVVTELVTNALKHAFPVSGRGEISIKASRPRPGQVELVVTDNGVGMARSREGSLGYGLIEAMVRKIGGELTVAEAAGVAVTIGFPAPETRPRPAVSYG